MKANFGSRCLRKIASSCSTLARVGGFNGIAERLCSFICTILRVSSRVAVAVLLSGFLYCSSFVLITKRVPVTTFSGVPILYFSRHNLVNRALWIAYWPLHRSCNQPDSELVWIVSQQSCDYMYVSDISVFYDILSPHTDASSMSRK